MVRLYRQRGFLTIILIALIILVAVIVIIASRFIVATSLNLSNQLQAAQAYALARGGLEHGIRAYKLNNNYSGNSGTVGGIPYQSSVFSTDFNSIALISNRKRIRGTGTVGPTTRIVESIIQLSNMVSSGDFDTSNCGFNAPWTITTTSDAPAPAYCGVNQGNPGNALLVQDNTGGNSQTLATENITSFTTLAATNFTVNYQYLIPSYSGNREAEVRFCFNTSSFCSGWQTYTAQVNTWTNDNVVIAVPINRTLTNFRVDMRANGNGTKKFLLDNVSVINPSNPSVTLIAYRELLQ